MFRQSTAVEFFENRIGSDKFTDDIQHLIENERPDDDDYLIATFVEYGTLCRPAGWTVPSELGKRLIEGYQTSVQFYELLHDLRYNTSLDEFRDQSYELMNHFESLTPNTVPTWEATSPQTSPLQWWKRYRLSGVEEDKAHLAVVFSDSRVCHLNAVLDPSYVIDTGNVRDLYNLAIIRDTYVPSFDYERACRMFYSKCTHGTSVERRTSETIDIGSGDVLLQSLIVTS